MDIYEYFSYKEQFFTMLSAEQGCSFHTLRSYKADFDQITNFWQKLAQSEPFFPHTLESVLKRYLVSLLYKSQENSTLARKQASLSSFLRFLTSEGCKVHIEFKPPKQEKRLPTVLSEDELSFLLDELSDEKLSSPFPCRDRAIIEFLYATGMRCSELAGICLNDLFLEEKMVKVKVKGGGERLCLFGSKAYAQLILYLSHERGLLVKNSCSHLFLNYAGTPLTTRSVQRVCDLFSVHLKSGKKLTPHVLRHSCATHLLARGADMRSVQEQLGHKSLRSTELYTHVTTADIAKAYKEKNVFSFLGKSIKQEKKEF